MKETGPIDLALGVLDHQLIDSEGRRCGKVDDLELEGVRDGKPRVAAIVSGPGAWRGRGRIGAVVGRVAPRRTVSISWDEVESIDSAVRLKRPARELRLARSDARARRWIEKLPGASLE